MTARLINPDRKELAMEMPNASLSLTGKMETERLVSDNIYAYASFNTTRTAHYAITDAYIRSADDIRVCLRMEANNYLWFCAALQGRINVVFDAKEDKWQSGQANLMSISDAEGYALFSRGKSFRMFGIMIAPSYLEQIAANCPGMLDEILAQHACRQFAKALPEHIRFCPRIGKALKEISDYESLGNVANIYLDAKVREILALFLCRTEQKGCTSCHCYSPKDNDMLNKAREIIEQEYLNPPSLHNLALMVGTNECKLKNGFKRLFGSTIFGYLYHYRMEMACKHLTDSDSSIQEIAILTGYEHHSHFSTAFKRRFNLSPQEYRQRENSSGANRPNDSQAD
jgi:AraC-like DNA-binding protein